jgi:hypothetical protein
LSIGQKFRSASRNVGGANKLYTSRDFSGEFCGAFRIVEFAALPKLLLAAPRQRI